MEAVVAGLVHAILLPVGESRGVDVGGAVVLELVAVEGVALVGFEQSSHLLAHAINLFLI